MKNAKRGKLMPHGKGYDMDYKNTKTSSGGYYRPMDSYGKSGGGYGGGSKKKSGNPHKSGY
jgi:hypothetical protein